MAEKDITKFMKSSDSATNSQIQHVLLIVMPDGRIRFNGTSNIVAAIRGNNELFTNLEETLKASYVPNNENIFSVGIIEYPRLPCPPHGDEWKKLSSKEIRAILTNMLNSSGYSRSGTRKSLGVGPCPLGWPSSIISWSDYQGATRSKLSRADVTTIIISLLEGAQLNPSTHIKSASSENICPAAAADQVADLVLPVVTADPPTVASFVVPDAPEFNNNLLDNDLTFEFESLEENVPPAGVERRPVIVFNDKLLPSIEVEDEQTTKKKRLASNVLNSEVECNFNLDVNINNQIEEDINRYDEDSWAFRDPTNFDNLLEEF